MALCTTRPGRALSHDDDRVNHRPSPTLSFVQPHRLVRWTYAGRMAISFSVYLAAVLVWPEMPGVDSLTAPLLLTGATLFTVASIAWTEFSRRRLSRGFLLLQSVGDLLISTTIVHLTGGGASQFAALFILVIATASLLQPTGASLLIAATACVFYFGEVLLWSRSSLSVEVWLQLCVFAAVALSSGYIGARVRDARTGAEELYAELTQVRLQAEDILRSIRSGVLTVDGGGALRYANPAAASLLGLSLGDQIGQPVIETLERTAPALARALTRATRDGVRTARAEGSVQLGSRVFPIGLHTTMSSGAADGTPVAARTATAIFQDISDQKRMDDLHMRAERLEAVAELSASLAHEIKNPLASIRSACEQLGRSPRTNVDEVTLAALVVRESDRLSRLLSEFLDFARVQVTRIGPVDMAGLAREAVNLAAAHPDRDAGVVVEAVVPANPVIVEGDEDLLHRAVFNLALNAVQATPAGGAVRVELEPIHMGDANGGISFDRGGVALRVSDHGPGIPESIRDRLFDPFFTTRPGGTGLGLSVVHRAIEAHRGFVFIDSDPGGTRVTVLLPNHQADSGGAL